MNTKQAPIQKVQPYTPNPDFVMKMLTKTPEEQPNNDTIIKVVMKKPKVKRENNIIKILKKQSK